MSTKKNLINSTFLKRLIENGYGERTVKILSYKVESVNRPPTDNNCDDDICDDYNDDRYCSTLIHISIRYKSKDSKCSERSLIGKIAQRSLKLDPMRDPDEIVVEQMLYERFLPRYMKQILILWDDEFWLAPNLIWSTFGLTDSLLLDDVIEYGFSTVLPEQGCNLDESVLTVQKLAFLHAASAVDLKKNSSDYALFNEQTYREDNLQTKRFVEEAFQILLKNSDRIEISVEIVDKLRVLQHTIWNKMSNDSRTKSAKFRVLNHGNLNCTTIMFKYNECKLCDALFINFQNSFVGSPVLDLMHFFASTVEYSVLIDHRDELIYQYHETLAAALEEFKYPGRIPQLHELANEINERRFLDLVLTVIIGPYLRQSGNKFRCLFNETDMEMLKWKFEKCLKYIGCDIAEQLLIFDAFELLDCDNREPENKVRKLTRFFENK